MSKRGHTLMELTVVIIIVGVLAAAMVVNMNSQSLHKLRAAAEKLASDIRYAQAFARATGNWAKVNFFGKTNAYDVEWVTAGSATENNIIDPLYPNKNINVDFTLATSPYQGVTFPVPTCQGANDLLFNALGVPMCCGGTHSPCPKMTGTFTVTLSYGGRQCTVDVMQETGMVTVSVQ